MKPLTREERDEIREGKRQIDEAYPILPLLDTCDLLEEENTWLREALGKAEHTEECLDQPYYKKCNCFKQALNPEKEKKMGDKLEIREEVYSLTLGKELKNNPFNPSQALLAKLGSIAVHVDEMLSPRSHEFDVEVVKSLLDDTEVKEWLEVMTKLAMVPKKRG